MTPQAHPFSRLLAFFFALVVMVGLSGPAIAGQAEMSAGDSSAFELEAPPAVPADWRTLEGLYARVHAHPDDLPTARALLKHSAAAIPRIAADLGLPPGGPMDIYLAPDGATFDAMQPGAPPDWADGTAWPRQGLIFLHSPRARAGTATPLTQVLDHEVVHIVLGRAFGPRPVPRWLQEGTAQIVAREVGPELTDRLSAGVLGDSLLGLDQITRGFPTSAVRAQLAYAQSADFVGFLKAEYGDEAFQQVIFDMARGRSVEASLFSATGLPLSRLDQEWRGRLTSSGIWLKTLVSDTVLLGGAALLFVVFGIQARRRQKERLAAMAREDQLQDALYAALAWPAWSDLPPLPRPSVGPRWIHPEADEPVIH